MKRLIALIVCLLLAKHSWAALALDGTPATINGAATCTSQTLTLTTSSTNDVVLVGIEVNGTTISSVTSAHLTFTQRAITTAAGTQDAYEFKAIASTALSSEVVTINCSGAAMFLSAAGFAISGADTSTVWDSNASLPATSTTVIPSMSTSNANDFLVALVRCSGAANCIAGTGWSALAGGSGGWFTAEYQIVSATQSSITPTINYNGGTSGTNGAIADAVIQAGSSPGACPCQMFMGDRFSRGSSVIARSFSDRSQPAP